MVLVSDCGEVKGPSKKKGFHATEYFNDLLFGMPCHLY